jgi:hypothetical protein
VGRGEPVNWKLVWISDEGEQQETGLFIDRAVEGSDTSFGLMNLFIQCVNLQKKKGSTYGEAWRGQGYMGNVARVLSKASRLKNMLWRDMEIASSEESVTDTAQDMINLLAFFLINKIEGNKWGR